MASVKMTFSLDEATARRLQQTSERLAMAKSQVVREAIVEYSVRADRTSEAERKRLLRAFDELVPRIPPRDLEAVEAEIEAVRAARHVGGRGRQS